MACSKCGKLLGLFYERYHCERCGCEICKDCSIKTHVDYEYLLSENGLAESGILERWCCDCFEKYREPIRNKINRLLDRGIPDIELVSANYKGFKPYIGEKRQIKSSFCDKIQDCDKELRFVAFYLGYDMVIEVSLEREECEDGNYIYSMFPKIGYAVKKDLSRRNSGFKKHRNI